MANIWQVTWRWTGFTGAPGYTNFYYAATAGDATEALAAATKSRLFFSGVASVLPTFVNVALVTDVRLIDDGTGNLVSIFTVTGISSVTGSAGSSAYPGPAGGCVDWITGVVHGKHLMTGRTFLVPLLGSAFDTNGSLASGIITTIATGSEAMRTASGPAFGVWGRPRAAKTVGGVVIPALSGLWSAAVSSRVPDKAVVLRSRRD
jgi:hypothetical protein